MSEDAESVGAIHRLKNVDWGNAAAFTYFLMMFAGGVSSMFYMSHHWAQRGSFANTYGFLAFGLLITLFSLPVLYRLAGKIPGGGTA